MFGIYLIDLFPIGKMDGFCLFIMTLTFFAYMVVGCGRMFYIIINHTHEHTWESLFYVFSEN